LSASAKTAGMTIAARAALFSAGRSATAGDDTSAPDAGEGAEAESVRCGRANSQASLQGTREVPKLHSP
jgi:hypothetical protein